MSPVVFTEGKHDLDFLTSLHRELGDGTFDVFINQEADTRQEARVRQHHFDDTMDYLYKAEGGRPEIYKKFRSHIDRIESINLIVLMDLDGDEPNVLFSEFNEKLDEQFRGMVAVEYNVTGENDHLLFFDCTLTSRDEIIATFDLITFKESLEKVTNIRDLEDRSEWIRKSKIYIQYCSSIMEDLCRILY